MGIKIAVTGSSGQLGQELRALCGAAVGDRYIFLDREDMDLSRPWDIAGTLERIRPDVIIHAGAYTSVDLAESEYDLADLVNHRATAAIAEYAAAHSVRLLYISTDYVFSGEVDRPLREDEPCDPVNAYGRSKRLGEIAVLEHAPGSIIIRTSWVYSSYGKNFVKTMLSLMSTREEINVVSDQFGSPTWARDLAEVILRLVGRADWVPGIYHYSNEGRISWYDFAVAIRDLAGLACIIRPIDSSEYPTAAKRPRFTLLDKGKFKRVFGIRVPFWKVSLIGMLKSSDYLKHKQK